MRHRRDRTRRRRRRWPGCRRTRREARLPSRANSFSYSRAMTISLGTVRQHLVEQTPSLPAASPPTSELARSRVHGGQAEARSSRERPWRR
ncbi:MAG: hypothetical protein MZV64_64470 [Ignavibacteriales bacterium]|nr:hypothetical protein [Ignavibacteriales bacterium]